MGDPICSRATIFLLPGGAFVNLIEAQNMDPNNNMVEAHSLAKKLVKTGFNVILAKYKLASGKNEILINNLTLDNNTATNLGECKARMEEASLTSFRDLRRILRESYNNSTSMCMDTNQVILAGISAGGFLCIYAGFLESNEMPSIIPYQNTILGVTSKDTIKITNQIKTEFYPIPKFAGIMPMNGGTLIKNIFNNQSANINQKIDSSGFAVYILHGTCDELISKDSGRVVFKLRIPSNPYFKYNTRLESAYPKAYGSNFIFNQLKGKMRIRYDQVCSGGHSVLTVPGGITTFGVWDLWDNTKTSNQVPNSTDPVFDRIRYFYQGLFPQSGISSPFVLGSPVIGFTPEKSTPGCLTDPINVLPITSLVAYGSKSENGFVYNDSLKINTGGEHSLIYRWKIVKPNVNTKWDTTFFPKIKYELAQFADLPYTFTAPGTFKFKVPIIVEAINGCNTKSYSTTVTFTALCITCGSLQNNSSAFAARMAGLNPELEETNIESTYAEKKLFIKSSKEMDAEIQILNYAGQIIFKKKLQLNLGETIFTDNELNLNNQPSGIYIISILSENYFESIKIVSQ